MIPPKSALNVKPGKKAEPEGNRKKPRMSAIAAMTPESTGPKTIADKEVITNPKLTLTKGNSIGRKILVKMTLRAINRPIKTKIRVFFIKGTSSHN